MVRDADQKSASALLQVTESKEKLSRATQKRS